MRPKTLVKLEDCVLEAILAISEGKAREKVLNYLFSQLISLEEDLAKDDEALGWFDLAVGSSLRHSSIPSSEIPSTPLAGKSVFRFL